MITTIPRNTNRAKTPESTPKLAITEIVDEYIRKNFEKLADYIKKENPLKGFRSFEVKFEKTEANKKFSHGLGFVPKDVFLTSILGTGSVQFNYANFTATELDLTITGTVSTAVPTTIRFLVGTLETPSG